MILQIGQSVTVVVRAKLKFGGDVDIDVKVGEVYSCYADMDQVWKDSFISTNAEGFMNPLLLFSGRRLSGVRCFTLCGTINQDELNHFKIGSSQAGVVMPDSGKLYFFANDSSMHYSNNHGLLVVTVTRNS